MSTTNLMLVTGVVIGISIIWVVDVKSVVGMTYVRWEICWKGVSITELTSVIGLMSLIGVILPVWLIKDGSVVSVVGPILPVGVMLVNCYMAVKSALHLFRLKSGLKQVSIINVLSLVRVILAIQAISAVRLIWVICCSRLLG